MGKTLCGFNIFFRPEMRVAWRRLVRGSLRGAAGPSAGVRPPAIFAGVNAHAASSRRFFGPSMSSWHRQNADEAGSGHVDARVLKMAQVLPLSMHPPSYAPFSHGRAPSAFVHPACLCVYMCCVQKLAPGERSCHTKVSRWLTCRNEMDQSLSEDADYCMTASLPSSPAIAFSCSWPSFSSGLTWMKLRNCTGVTCVKILSAFVPVVCILLWWYVLIGHAHAYIACIFLHRKMNPCRRTKCPCVVCLSTLMHV